MLHHVAVRGYGALTVIDANRIATAPGQLVLTWQVPEWRGLKVGSIHAYRCEHGMGRVARMVYVEPEQLESVVAERGKRPPVCTGHPHDGTKRVRSLQPCRLVDVRPSVRGYG